MLSLDQKGAALPVSWMFQVGESIAAFKHKLRSMFARALFPAIGVVALAGGIAITFASVGVRPTHTVTPHTTKPKTPITHVVTQMPQTANSVSAATCPGAENQSLDIFAQCPSFMLNYANKITGAVDLGVLNIYTGAPEANNEAQLYTSSSNNLRVENGALALEARNDVQQGFNYTSARIDTKGKEDFLYGRVVVRATLPNGVGTWPAIWMLPSESRYASLSPAGDPYRYMNDGEIDIAEAVGTDAHTIYGIAHSLAYPEDGRNRNYFDTTRVYDSNTVYHNYEVDWTPTNLTFRVDGSPFFSIDKKPGADYHSWPYDQPFYLIVNLALGGSWGGTDTAQFPGDGVDKNALPATLKVQSVRYYPYIGPK